MKCVIIAAGHGSRLRSLSASKPLALLNGIPLLERVIRAAAEGGASDFTIVTGYRAGEVEAFVADAAGRLGLSARCRRTEDWDRPNGFSVATGAEGIGEPFLLLMSDHLFDPSILRDLSLADGAALTLAVDRDHGRPDIDLEDATRVLVGEDGAIRKIGKMLEPYNAIDTGLFMATPDLREAILKDADAGGVGSLSDGVRSLAAEGRAFTMEIGGRWWIDVDDPAAFALAEQKLSDERDYGR
jgi:1L-myo-inositol 1-phosphate cytidylyltransferase